MSRPASPRIRAFTGALLASTALVGIGLVPLCPVPVRAEPLPTGGQVVSGGVTIGAPNGNALAITQSSQSAIVNWQGFSVGGGNRVDIHQPNANAAILNRVTGATPSTIAGQLNANGQVYLVNPNGVTITRSGQVNAAGFVASSLGISDEDFKAGRRPFRGSGASAPVTNHGAITIGRGGYAALIGGRVTNTGTIQVPMGRVGLGAGERATLDLSGDGFLQVAVPTQAKGRGALVEHAGTISADGGSVTLTAAAARDMARQAVNLSGVVEARAVAGRNGRITLSGGEGAVALAPNARLDASGLDGADGGRVRITGGRLDVAGRVDVSGARGGRARLKAGESLALSGRVLAEGRTGQGGRVTATAPTIATHAALIEASGASGGGVVRVGGGRLGQGPLARAERVTVDAASTIRADATVRGDGGDVVVWSDVGTRFAGTITARGGASGGNGGQAEVSSKGVLSYDGTTLLTAARGAFGTLLLDPHDITIANAPDSGVSGFTATGERSVIDAAGLLTALTTANVVVSTGPTGNESGTITVAAPLTWNTGANLTLQAAGGIALNAPITAPAGGLILQAGAGSAVTATADLSVARFTLASGNWTQNAATLPGFATADFRIADGASFLRAAGGAGTNASPYRLSDIYGLQGMGSSADYRAASYRLASDIDAAGTATWWGGQGFVPVGTDAAPFTGSLDGAGHTVSGLTIARPNQSFVGLIGYLDTGGSVSGLGLVGGSVTGSDNVGGLVGNNSGTVSRSYASGSVTGSLDVGGLVGNNTGTVSQSYASGSVTGSLVSSYMGGLVGSNTGTVSQSYASGSVTGSSIVGGLVGNNTGTVSQSYASGSVTGSSLVGGLVGSNTGPLTSTYWDTQTTGRANGVGAGSSTGATGLTTAQARSQAGYINPLDTTQSFDFGTVWYQAGDLRPILRSEAAAPVGGVIPVSNLHQLQLMGANLAGSYRLTRDLDASATAATDASTGPWGAGGFVPVGTSSARFTGSLDGAGHTITGLTIARPSQNYVGLIGLLGAGGGVSGLGLVGGSVTGSEIVGALVGTNHGTVSQSYASGRVTGSNYVGGLVGNNDDGRVSQSYASGSVTGSNSVGGLVGYNSSTGTVSQSYASGSVTGSSNYVGGLVGNNSFGGRVSQSYASGSVTGSGSSSVGGLVGKNDDTLTNTYWDKDTTGQSRGVGVGSSAGTTGLTTAQARSQTGYINLLNTTQRFDFGTVWYQAGDMRPILRSEAAAPVGGVIPVSNLHQLQLMGANLAGSYRLTRDLDASATAATDASTGPWGAGGFVPVGTSSTPFTGSLDGAGHTITGLTIARPGQNFVGLIGDLGTGGRVSGLGLVGGSVTGSGSVGGLVGGNVGTVSQSYTSGSVTGSSGVGGLVGTNNGTVSQSYASGSVSGSSGVGGLVGHNSSGTVSQSYASGRVTGSSNYVGGLVGTNNGTVSQSYASGSATGSSSVGGLVGYNSGGTVSQSYASGSATGSSRVGGLVGNNDGTVSQSYASGSVSGSSSVGGLVGRTVGALENTYWDTQATGQSRGVGAGSSAGATGLTTAQMQDLASFRANYAGFDFATVWAPPNQVGQGGQGIAFYPQLYGLSNVVAVTPSSSRTYGSGSAPIASYAGLRPGDFVTTLGTLSSGASRTSDVGNYAVTASGTAVTSPAGNATRILYVPGTLSITPATITVTGATGVTKTYDGTTALPGGSTGFTSAGVLFGDDVRVAGNAAYDSARAGTRSVLVSGLSLSGAKAGNYVLSAVAGTGTIDRASLAVSGVTALDKTYDGTAAATLSGTATVTAFSGDVVALGGTGTGSFADKNAATNKPVTVTGYTLSGTDAGNYTLVQPTGLTADIARATLTYTADAVRRTYGAASPALTGTVTGFVPGESLASATTGTLAFGTTATASSNVDTYAITGSGLSAGNYVLVQAAGNAAALTVDPAALSISGARTYDATTGFTADQITVAGGVNGETLTLTAGSGTAASADAGTYAGSSLTGLRLAVAGGNGATANYRLPATATLSIAPAPVIVTARSGSSTYGDTPADPGLSASGLVGGEGVGVLTGLSSGFGLDAASAAGRYTLAVAGTLTNRNYRIDRIEPGTFTVDPRALTVTADAQTRRYGDPNPALTYTVGGRGLVNGDRLAGALATGAAVTSGVGGYAVTQGSLAASANYRLTYQGADLAVTARPVTLSGTRVYDANTGIAGGLLTIANRVDGDSVSVSGTGTLAGRNAGTQTLADLSGLRLSNPNYTLAGAGGTVTVTQALLTARGAQGIDKTYDGTAALPAGRRLVDLAGILGTDAGRIGLDSIAAGYDSGDAGPRTITVSGLRLTGAEAANYRLSATSVIAAGTIAPASITVTAQGGRSVYGDTPADPGLSASGLVGGQDASVLTGLSNSFDLDAASAAGRYTLAVTGSLTNRNYVVADRRSGTWTVTPRALVVTPDALTRAYGEATPARGTAAGDGLVNGDRLDGVGLLTPATAASGVGRYALTGTDATFAAGSAGNYAITYTTRGDGLTIVPRAVTVTAQGQTRVYGDANPTLTYTVGGRGLADGEALSGSLATIATAGSGVGDYAITQGSLAASANYALTYQGADLAVTPRAVTLSGTRVYDGGTGFVGGLLTAGNLVNGDAITVAGTGILAAKDAGSRALSDLSGLALSNPNYTLSGAAGTVAIMPATLTYTADAARRTYGSANPALTGRVAGFLGADTPANSTTGTLAFTTQAGAGSNVGSYAVTGSGLSAGNYLLVQAAGNATALTVAPALLTVTGTKTYDATTEFHAGQLAVAGGVTGETVTLTAGAGSPLSADAAIYTGSRLTGLRLAVAGGNGLASNYALPATGTLTITPALVTVAAEGGRSVYGDTPIDPGLSASGLVGGQDASVLTGLSSSFDLDATRAAGAYRLTVTGRLTNGNYRVGASEAGRYTIDRRPLTITADGLTRVYGDANPILTYTLGGRGLANGDRLTGVLATAADADSEPGLYRITRGSLSASANYSLGFVGADLAVLARPTQPQPEPRPIALAPSGLASSVERAARLDARPVAPDLPLLLGAGPDGALRVSDPRFDATLVCTRQQGGCFLTPLIAAPAPQAGLSAR
ncbi:filamentous hemagglutinin N-terminal domain-containing protein [Methylorubrum sp. Q1]|uniref:MBG domain-containing protein n=1 Tax=Methylorubrum sp. Q1 TaxID=2562453 RepID=UPI0010769F79|nr:MBG domain-containing protein [Methylorubrum sp. Q1]TFZ54812.1 filamentous hemagglutinin N-terminal domain-containing protein [Methylorubrum sp. Q1]